MHLVYRIVFVERLGQGIKPYYYIGSKSNCVLIDGVMYQQDRLKNPYWGSPKDKKMQELIGNSKAIVEELKWFDIYEDCLSFERSKHIECDVVANVEYFNRGVAMENNFSNPEYATYKNIETGKVARLPKLHEAVLSGVWVGVTSGRVIPKDEALKRGRKGESNSFFGKSHSEETKLSIKEGRMKWNEENPEREQEIQDAASKRMELMSKGIPKSEEHKKKIGRKNRTTYKNLITGESVRVDKSSEQHSKLDFSIWVPPITYASRTGTLKKICCVHCGTEGIPANINRWHNDNCKYKKEKENEN